MVLPLKYYWWMVSICLFLTCTPIYNKSKLTLIKGPFEKERVTFLTNGYYFHVRSIKSKQDSSTQSGILPIIFYQDGYVHRENAVHGLRTHSNDLEKRDSLRKSLQEYEKYLIRWNQGRNAASRIDGWGRYKQYGNEIVLQHYVNYGGRYILVEYAGKVLNPKTIVFTSKHYPGHPLVMEEKHERIHELFEFVPRSVKPDSSNYIRSNLVKFDRKAHAAINEW